MPQICHVQSTYRPPGNFPSASNLVRGYFSFTGHLNACFECSISRTLDIVFCVLSISTTPFVYQKLILSSCVTVAQSLIKFLVTCHSLDLHTASRSTIIIFPGSDCYRRGEEPVHTIQSVLRFQLSSSKAPHHQSYSYGYSRGPGV
jgi:hypothetical protein